MSLINDVLRDLEMRRAGDAGASRNPIAGLNASASRGPGGSWGSLVLALVLLAGGFALWQRPGVSDAPTTKMASRTQSGSAASELPAVASAPPARDATTGPGVAARNPTPRPPTHAATRNDRDASVLAEALEAEARESTPPTRSQRPVPSAGRRAERAYRDGLRRAARGEIDAADMALRQAISLAPDHRAAREAHATLLARAGDAPGAIRVLAEGIARDPDHLAFLLLEARIRSDQGDAEGAIELLRQPPLARSAEAQGLLAALYQRDGRIEEAARLYSAALGVDARRPRWWLGLGLARESMGDRDEAYTAYDAANRLGGLDAETSDWLRTRLSTVADGN